MATVVRRRELVAAVRILRQYAALGKAPVTRHGMTSRDDPFRVLIGCILSLRTKDETTGPACRRLFTLARTPAAMARLTLERIERAIYPVGFYRTKARAIREICRSLLAEHEGRVPASEGALLALPGVGPKTANLVLSRGFGQPAICVDTHVHRIANRWGCVRTRTPAETEAALRRKLPRRYWSEINSLLVALGQTVCRPLSPRCSVCPLCRRCARRGVERHR